MFKILFLAFLLVPLLELYLLIKIGGQIGAGWTLSLVLLTAALGAWLVKLQGLSTMQRAQQSIQRGEAPAMQVLEGMVLFLSGFMLLVPGFATDIAGFVLLIPGFRRHVLAKVLRNSQVFFRHSYQSRHYRQSSDDVIEGEVVKPNDEQSRLR